MEVLAILVLSVVVFLLVVNAMRTTEEIGVLERRLECLEEMLREDDKK